LTNNTIPHLAIPRARGFDKAIPHVPFSLKRCKLFKQNIE
jgi:hypothetical protein